MKVLIATDVWITQYRCRYYIASAFYTILKRYSDAFGSIVLCSRMQISEEEPSKQVDATELLEDVVSVRQTEAFFNRCGQKMESAVSGCDLVVGRLPSIIAYRAIDAARKSRTPYLAEVMGCAWDAYWNHGILGKLIAPYMYWKMRRCMRHAAYAAYVTSYFLQNRYPCKRVSLSASNVRISESSEAVLYKRLEKVEAFDSNQISMMTTAAVNVRYKGQEYVIRAIGKLKKKGITVQYYLAGGGDRTFLSDLARQYGVIEQVVFLGVLSPEEVFFWLDRVDLYIQPSLQEGLPRAVIEAMSRGCPVLGADTAGIPELIAPECVFKRKSAEAIAAAVIKLSHKDMMLRLAAENFRMSQEYHEPILNARRNAYYHLMVNELKSSSFENVEENLVEMGNEIETTTTKDTLV